MKPQKKEEVLKIVCFFPLLRKDIYSSQCADLCMWVFFCTSIVFQRSMTPDFYTSVPQKRSRDAKTYRRGLGHPKNIEKRENRRLLDIIAIL